MAGRASPAALRWAAPVATMAVAAVAVSLSMPLFALLLERMGVSGTMVGLNHTMSAIAMVASAPILPAILGRLGVMPVLIASIVALTAGMLAIPLFESYWWWAALRVIFGFAVTALFYAAEYWLMARAPDATRGRIMAFYSVVVSVSYMLGPILLAWMGTAHWRTFAFPAAIIALSALPILLGRGEAPPRTEAAPRHPLSLLRFLWTDPLVMWGVVLFGIVEFGVMGLIPNWGIRAGYDEATAVRLVVWLAFGALVLQMPIGWLAERADRRLLLAGIGGVCLVMPLVTLAGAQTLWLVSAAIFVWGGIAVGLYTLALIELAARYKGAVLAEAHATVMLAYGLGALISPSVLGWGMDTIPPNGLLWLAAAFGAAYLALAVVRLARHPREPLDSGR